jgi:protein-glutamine gamma-glutamyltransferase
MPASKRWRFMAKRTTKSPSRPPAPLERGAVPWLLAVALATAGPHAMHLPLWLSLLVGALLVWRAWAWQRNARLPARWLLAMLVVGGVAGIGWQFHTLFGRDAGVALLVLLVALKPMELHSRRDALVVIMLGFFLLLTHYFYSQSIPTGLWLLAAATLLTAALLRLHGGRQPVGEIARYAGVLLAQALPFMLILYLLFPRVAGPLWGLPQDAYAGLTGLSEQMAPGSLSNLIQSGAIAFRAQFSGAPPAQADLYWRGPVLNEYDGRTWRTGAPAARATKPAIEARGKIYRYVSTVEAHNQRWLLALDVPTGLPADSALAPTFEALAREPLRSRTRWAFTSAADFRANLVESPAVLQQALRLPPTINPRSRALAAAWQKQARAPEDIAAAALAMFRTQAFFYTLRPPLLGEQAMDEFLFVTRRGFCEHYASAFVFLMRAAGVPARVVTGYQGGEINPVDGFLTVRQSDAHAWAEIWLAGQGWVRIDPTAAVAPSRIEQGIAAALPSGEPLPMLLRIDADWLRDLRNRWEATNNAWNQWVLGYNPQRQQELLSRLGFTEPDWRSMTAALALLCGLALLAVTAWALDQRQAADPVQRAWQRYCARLARLGISRADWEGPCDFAARVARERPELAAVSNDAAKHYAALRYGQGKQPQLRLLQQCTRRLPHRWRKTT